MKKTFLFKLLLSFILVTIFLWGQITAKSMAQDTFVSIAPSVTEIVYALGLQDKLIGVSDRCNYPNEAKSKERIGSLYGINKEKIIKLHPKYILALIDAKPFLNDLENSGSTVIYFDFKTVQDILDAIVKIGDLFNANDKAKELVRNIKNEIEPKGNGKTILYVIQSRPLITIGSKSFLTDIIRLSGNTSITKDIPSHYPSISLEYAMKLDPDYIVMGPFANPKDIEPFFKNKKTKFILLTQYQNDVINRPGPRIWESVRFFGELK